MSPTKIEQRRKFSTLDRLRQSYLSILLENIRFASYTRRLLQKRTEIKNCIKNLFKIFLIQFCGNPYTSRKNHLCFYKNSTNQTFTFISNKVVYFKKHLASTAPFGKELSNAITCSVLPPDNYACISSSVGDTCKNMLFR